MRSLVVPILIGVLLIGAGISCEKISTESASAELTGPLGDLPASYGRLVSVTAMPEYPGWFQLWFSDDTGTIRIVRVHMTKNLMHTHVKTINRGAGL